MSFLERPIFKPHLRVEPVPGEGVFLLHERGQHVLEGKLYEQISPLIDGRTTDDLVKTLAGKVPPNKVYYVLNLLQQKGFVVESKNHFQNGHAAFWSAQNVDLQQAADRLKKTEVSLTAFGDVASAPMNAALKSFGVSLNDTGELGVVVTDDYLQSGLETYNREQIKSGRPWILVKPVGLELWFGPVFRPGTYGCWECLARRIRDNQEVSSFVRRLSSKSDFLPVTPVSTPGTQQIAWNLAALEVSRIVIDTPTIISETQMATLNLSTLKTQIHKFQKLSDCSICGEVKPVAKPQAPELQSVKKKFTSDGGHRTVSPETTLKKYRHLVSPITGVVQCLEPISPDEKVPVYISGSNMAMLPDNLKMLKLGLRSMSAGKGKTEIQAKVSALCEAIERYSGLFKGDVFRTRSSYNTLGKQAIHPNDCMQFSDRQYKNRETLNARESRFNYVTERLDDDTVISWTPVWSLSGKHCKYLPTSYLYFYPKKLDEPDFCRGDSNGNASGNTLEEAILQGFFELVERDAVALWWYNRIKKPGVDLASFEEPYFADQIDYYKTLDREIWALDLTSDLRIPTFAGLSRKMIGDTENITVGFGSHFDPKIALQRALTEMNQSLNFAKGFEENSDHSKMDDEMVHWYGNATLDNQPYLVADENQTHSMLTDYSLLSTDDFLEDVRTCQRIVENLGMEMFVLDQTRAETGLSVVKVIVPGLRHFWERFAPGRLYDVPVKMGWLENPTPEEELNPIPMFL